MLNLIASILFFAALTVAAVLVWRRLPQAAAASTGEPVCMGCGTPARLLPADSFLCPTCGRDVRDLGIGLARPRRVFVPFWRLVNFSAGLCLIALIVTGIVGAALPFVNYNSAEWNYEFSNEAYQRLDVSFSSRHTGNGPLEGNLYADLLFNDGDLVTLQIQSPSYHYRLIDANGQESPLSQDEFGEDAVLNWMAAGGMDRANPDVRDQADWMRGVLKRALGDNSQVIRVPGGRARNFSSGGGSTGNSGPSELVFPVSVIGWSVVWLIGVWLIVRPGKVKPLPDARSTGVPA